MLKYEKMVEEILTNRYVKIIEENRLWFFRYKECCKEAALKEMENKKKEYFRKKILSVLRTTNTTDGGGSTV